MRKFVYGGLTVLLLVLAALAYQNYNQEQEALEESSRLIQEQIRNVGKLVVSEGSFAQVYTYKNSKSFYLDILSAEKKALIVVNARVTVAYDLSKLEVDVIEETKTVRVTHIPEEEISIYPDIRYYDISQDYLNPFKAGDHNKIKDRIQESLREKVEVSPIKKNAKNRLISELQKIYILTSSLGWTLEYRGEPMDSEALSPLEL